MFLKDLQLFASSLISFNEKLSNKAWIINKWSRMAVPNRTGCLFTPGYFPGRLRYSQLGWLVHADAAPMMLQKVLAEKAFRRMSALISLPWHRTKSAAIQKLLWRWYLFPLSCRDVSSFSFGKAQNMPYLQSFEELFGNSHGVFGAEEVASSDPLTAIFNNRRHKLPGKEREAVSYCLGKRKLIA